MLGKLIKHEWIRMWKVPTVSLVFINILAVASGRTFYIQSRLDYMVELNFINGIIMILFIGGLIGISFGIYIYLAVNFYKSAFSDEGYLLHTLPVTPGKILVSKILLIGIWQFIVTVGLGVALFIMIFIASTELQVDWSEVGMYWGYIKGQLKILFASAGLSPLAFFLVVIMYVITGFFYTGTYLVSAITLGQLARKHRIAAAILAGVVINSCISTISGISQFSTIVLNMNREFDIQSLFLSLVFNLIVYIAAIVVLFFISRYIITKKLNLE